VAAILLATKRSILMRQTTAARPHAPCGGALHGAVVVLLPQFPYTSLAVRYENLQQAVDLGRSSQTFLTRSCKRRHEDTAPNRRHLRRRPALRWADKLRAATSHAQVVCTTGRVNRLIADSAV